MAYEIIGTVYKIGTTENVPTKNGQPFQRRSLTLIQKRFDQNTGQEFEPNYPTIDFTQRGCAELDKYKQGDMVRVRFDVSGVKYNDKQTREEKYFNSLRGFRIEPFVMRQPQQPAPQPQYPPQGGYPPQQPYQGQYQQPAGYPTQQPAPQQPYQPQFPPQNPNDDAPF